ncbi:MAG TPA: FAD-binding protein [Candidatus Diapherotrites archaeon]|nr:FAD-binding protein [Candidatus Diapherotrites archaeon]
MTNNYDIIIIGAGPAGIFSAYELTKSVSTKDLKILLIDKGQLVKNRQKTDVMTGFGGSGTFSDGKLHFTPVLSHEKMFHLYSISEYQEYLDYVEKLFIDFGVPPEYYPKDLKKTQEIVDIAQKNNIKLFIRKTIHVGTDRLPAVIQNIENHLKKHNIELLPNTEVVDLLVKDNVIYGVKLIDGTELNAKYVICAPGRYNSSWVEKLSQKYNLEKLYDKIEVGVRVEFPAALIAKHAELMYETVYLMYSKTYDDVVRTFCPCPNGYVATEEYDDFVCVNGYSNHNLDGKNSNFALVTEVKLTEPLENTRLYANFVAQGATLVGGGKPIVQRFKDLQAGRRSTYRRLQHAHISPSLKEAIPGDIGLALPYRITKNLIEGIEMLDKILPGLNGDSTFLYAPEVKFRSTKIKTNKYLETQIKNLFMIGDGAGVSGNIVSAAITGVIAAQGIIDKEKQKLISNYSI